MKTIKTMGDNTVCILPSIIFNNKTINLFILCIVPPFLYLKYHYPFIWFAIIQLLFLILVILISPLKLMLSSSGIQYHMFWKIKWSNVKSYTINKDVLIINTKDGMEKKVKNLDFSIAEAVDEYINKKINGSTLRKA